jgi:bacteriocin-like protein
MLKKIANLNKISKLNTTELKKISGGNNFEINKCSSSFFTLLEPAPGVSCWHSSNGYSGTLNSNSICCLN